MNGIKSGIESETSLAPNIFQLDLTSLEVVVDESTDVDVKSLNVDIGKDGLIMDTDSKVNCKSNILG